MSKSAGPVMMGPGKRFGAEIPAGRAAEWNWVRARLMATAADVFVRPRWTLLVAAHNLWNCAPLQGLSSIAPVFTPAAQGIAPGECNK